MKIRTCLFIVVIMVVAVNGIAQTKCDCYERLTMLSNLQYTQNKYDESYKSLLKALSYRDTVNWNTDDYHLLADFDTHYGNFKEAQKHIRSFVSQGGKVESLKYDTSFNRYMDVGFIKELKDIELNNKLKINLDYLIALQQIHGIDQAIRNDYFINDSTLKKVFHHIDSANFYELKTLIEKYGFPNFHDHGFTDDAAWTILLHASVTSDTLYHQVLIVLEKAQEKGLVKKSRIALIIDRHRTWVENKKELFGEWMPQYDPPIDDILKIDVLRFQYNLLTFGDKCRWNHFKIPTAYKEASYPTHYFCN